MYGVIYKYLNTINNKVYIGQTIRDLEQRNREHLYGALKKVNKPFYNAINKYGMHNFNISILDAAESFDELNFKEIFYIKYFNSTNTKYGYNLSEGGNSPILRGENNGMYGRNHTEESKEKMSLYRKGKSWDVLYGCELSKHLKIKMSLNQQGSKRTEETKEKMKENHWLKNKGFLILGENNPNFGHFWDEKKKNKMRGKNNGMYDKGYLLSGENNGMYGKHHTKEAKEKMSEKRSGENNPRYYEIETEELFTLYEKGYSIPHISNIININRNKIRRELINNGISIRNISEQKLKNSELKSKKLL